MSVILCNWRKSKYFVCYAIHCPLNLTTGKKYPWGMRGGGTERYVHLSNIHICMHTYTGKLHRFKKKLFALTLHWIYTVSQNYHHFNIKQGFAWNQLSKSSLVKQMKPTPQMKRHHYVWPILGGLFLHLIFLYTNSEAQAVHNMQRKMSKIHL